ncbi:SCO family protein [Haliea sp. E17]|uniref:SCO family protein n=1 Tax=Haliea sp. E17 TaxID=3401576 RepID=UPI003AAD4551
MKYWAAAVFYCFLPLFSSYASGEPSVLAPGYGKLAFTPPTPGTYSLPPLGKAADGVVLDLRDRSQRLYDVLDGKLILLGFIYTHCPDINGCPLASYVMKQVQERLVVDTQLRDQVRLISLSFDPTLDTPEAMQKYSHHFKRKDFDWRFLTTHSEVELMPILQGYGQSRQKVYDKEGNYAGSMSHILRVYLIDRGKSIRNIYSAGFLHADTVVNDLETLLLEEGQTIR